MQVPFGQKCKFLNSARFTVSSLLLNINCVDRENHVYHKMFHSISKTNVRENVVHFAET